MPARSTTCPVSFGTAMGSPAAANAGAAMNSIAAANARAELASITLLRRRGVRGRRRRLRGLRREVDLRRRSDRLLVLDRERRLLLVAEDHRGQVHRELADEHVVFLHRLDEAVARCRDAVLGAFELRLQLAEVLVALELRIVLRDDEESSQGARELALRLRE